MRLRLARAASLKAVAMIRSPRRPAVARLAAILSATALMATAGVACAQSRPLSVQIDQSARVQLRAPAGSVIVGNPQIADVTVVDANTLFITGKGYGVTEIVAVDALGRTVFQSQVVVSAGDTGNVRVWRGAQATEMACGASCSPTIRSAADAPPAP
ncbi:pilus assembly protein N-terminal domain-containing protein [Brevundimonas sp.]|uniref:pilus assembly protein N-terminal domain-containing protein n=1 Tax=Brevundimonas sp. TaxID=1871086 RepID=UPI002AB8088A|nr:pilus assembly protein N-terminal domain-containing protein [Brevundimonas sp.]MDZ4364615.1 pilus assembly protein N-terminal domain-containing protein [Brevundimonas sp.]